MLKIGGLQKVTLIDYPGKVAAAVFLAGCNFRCPYCHNPDLVKTGENKKQIEEEAFFYYLEKRRHLLEGVSVSGGEPLLVPEIKDFLQRIKALGLAVKLDTNGSNPDLLRELIEAGLLDYIAMDIKAPLNLYQEVAGVKVDVNKVQKSIKTIMDSGLDYEFRTTVLPKWHNLENLEKIAKLIKGAANYYLQPFRSQTTLAPAFAGEKGFSDGELKALRQIALQYVKNCQIRG